MYEMRVKVWCIITCCQYNLPIHACFVCVWINGVAMSEAVRARRQGVVMSPAMPYYRVRLLEVDLSEIALTPL